MATHLIVYYNENDAYNFSDKMKESIKYEILELDDYSRVSCYKRNKSYLSVHIDIVYCQVNSLENTLEELQGFDLVSFLPGTYDDKELNMIEYFRK